MPNVDSDLAERVRAARRDPELVVLEGFHALKHALRFGAELADAVTSDPAGLERSARELAPDLDVLAIVRAVPADELAALGAAAPVDVVAIARRPAVDAGDALVARRDRPAVLLEGPRHLGNVGAAIRVAAAADAACVLVTGTADPWHATAVRGAAGLQFALPVARVDRLPASGRPLVALDPAGSDEASPPSGALLAFGSERRGLSDELLARAHMRVRLPMRDGVSSLNLATAVAAALYRLR